jgi:hypothetical protein
MDMVADDHGPTGDVDASIGSTGVPQWYRLEAGE